MFTKICRNRKRRNAVFTGRVATTMLLAVALWPGLAAAGSGSDSGGGDSMSLQLSSSAFTPDHPIPPVYTCEGRNISPPLAWNGLPPQTKSLALIVDDPDAPDPKAPKMTWVHWVLYNIPSETAGLPEDATETGLPSGTKQGLNNWNRVGYGGPCPPIGTHRYFFKLYALDTTLPDLGEVSKKQLVEAMEKHLLGQAQLMGTYRKVKGK